MSLSLCLSLSPSLPVSLPSSLLLSVTHFLLTLPPPLHTTTNSTSSTHPLQGFCVDGCVLEWLCVCVRMNWCVCVDGWMCVCVTAWGSRRGCRPPSLPPLGGDVCVPPPGPGGGGRRRGRRSSSEDLLRPWSQVNQAE